MLGKYFAVGVAVLAVSTLCLANNTYVVPTTTLTLQLSNNTSAANGFASQANGNHGAANISKVDVHSLLYSGATTKIYAHMVLWFGQSSHMNIGYNSTDPGQVKKQIDDMVSRGIDGVILDWYGPNNSLDQATLQIMAEAEKHPGFTFAIMIDQGAIEWYSCPGCSPQQAFVNELQYLEHTYFSSPAYMKIQGQPVVTEFSVDQNYPSIDWNAASAALSTHPIFLFQNNNGFSHAVSDGSYSWVMPTTTDYGVSYLSSFYNQGKAFPNEQTVGAVYKGFNDKLASWGSNRVMAQQCGQTWLQTFAEVNNRYSAGEQLSELQLVTWNDYEEATEIESGIDNCFALYPLLSGNSIQWTISGNENTVDHYTAYISTDGQNLMSLTDLAIGVHSLNLCSFPIPSGSYKLFVQAVGKPALANQMTNAVSYSPSCPATAPTPSTTIAFSASPTALTIPAGQSATLTVTAAAQSGASNIPISLSCAAVPSTLSCSFSPATITPGGGSATSTLTISTVAVRRMNSSQNRRSMPIYASWLLSFGILGFAFAGNAQGRRKLQALAIVGLLGVGMITSSCGSSGPKPVTAGATNGGTSAAPLSYPVTINGDSSASQLSTTVNVIVQ